ncbi:hypothetical protein [Cohnella boryungensis]|uniref:DUF3169 family protein n=1 Tax=Cohnella boryungensis TaxID=768479 RepID=A0ABV8SD95_9BACL
MVKTLKILAISTFILAFIGGIVCGNVYAIEPEYRYDDEKFNWAIALALWVSGAISGIFILAFSFLLEHVENMSYNIQMLVNENKGPSPSAPKLGNSKASLSKLSGYSIGADRSE